MGGINKLGFLDGCAFALLDLLMKRKHYLRELAEESGFSPSMVHKIMSRLEKEKMVLAESSKNRKSFSLDYSSPLTTRVLSLLAIHKLVSAGAFRKLLQMKPKGIYLFGTAASGKITADSDIDLAVFFDERPDAFLLSNVKRGLSNEIKTDLQLVILTKEKIEGMKKGNVELLNQIKNQSVVLFGELFD